MAVIVTSTTIAETNDTANTTTYASGTFTPVANRLYLLAAVHSDAAPEATVPTVTTTTGLTFVQVGSSIAFDTIASNVHRITLFRAMKASGLSTGTYTVTLADAATGCASVLIEVTQVVTTGTDGADAVRNASTNAANAGANPSITMGAFNSNNNGIVSFFGFDAQTAATAPDGWAVIGDASYNTPATGITALWRGANNATADCTHGAADWGGIAVEVVSEAVPDIQPPQPPDPPKKKAGLTAAILAGACFFVQVPGAAAETISGVAGGDQGVPLPPKQVQYQSVAAPVVIPPTAPSVPDQWWPIYPDRIPYAPRGVESGRLAIPLHVPDVTDPVPARSWAPSYPDRIARTYVSPETTIRQPIDTPAVVASTDSGAGVSDGSVLTRARQVQYVSTAGPVRVQAPVAAPDFVQAVYPAVLHRRVSQTPHLWLQAEFGFEVDVPVQSWAGSYPDRVDRKQVHASRQLAFFFDRFDPPVNIPAPDLSWQRNQPDLIFRPKRLVEAPSAVAPLYVADVTVGAPARSWAPVYPDRIVRARVAPELSPSFAFDRFAAPGTVTPPDLVVAIYPDRVGTFPDRARRHGVLVEPIYLADVTVSAPVLSWHPTYPDYIWTKTSPAWTVVAPQVLLVPDTHVIGESVLLTPEPIVLLTPRRKVLYTPELIVLLTPRRKVLYTPELIVLLTKRRR